jgi:very-short-patch-repair endonuclease
MIHDPHRAYGPGRIRVVTKGTAGFKQRTITCGNCGVTVTKHMPAGRQFCSLSCYRTSGRAGRKKSGVDRACARCGTGFYVPRSRIDKGEGQFCSLACHNANQGRAKTDHTCKMCGKGFRWSPSRTAGGNYNVTYCSLPCRDADPDRRALLLRMSASLQLRNPTSAELAGYALLDELGLEYVRQPTFGGKFTPDAAIPSARLVVQFDGDYWHDRKGTSTETRILRRVASDHSQDRYIRACGWEVVRLWATDLTRDPDGCLDKVSQLAHRPLPAAPERDPLAPKSGLPATAVRA